MIIDITNNSVYDVEYWQAERFLIKLQTSASEVRFDYMEGGTAVTVARYVPANGELLMDVTDFARAYPERNRFVFQYGQTGRYVTYSVAGRINPAGVLIPRHALLEAQEPALVIPPQKMLLDVQNSAFVMAEFYSKGADEWEADGFAQWENDRRNLAIFNFSGFSLQYKSSDSEQEFRPELVDTCKPFALVEWESFTGATRRHVFYIAKQTNETEETIALENVQNEYTEIKGETDGFSLRLEDLTRYDLWYYSDMITSSNVRVSIDGGSTFYRVQVTDKKYTIPDTDAGRLSTLEIAIKFRKYDTI